MLRWLRSVGSGRPTGGVLAANYLYLRKVVGWLGTLLPLILLAANPIALSIEHSSCGWLPNSVSGYYYSPVRNIFVGVFGLGVVFFPTTPTVASPGSATCETVSQLSSRQQVIGDVHAVASVLFLLFLAWMAIRFTTTDSPQPSPEQLLRNRIYWVCAIVILACVLAAVVTNFLPASLRPDFPWLFLYEAVGVFAFGISWFVDDQTLSAMGQ